MNNTDLEERLIKFAVIIIDIARNIPKDYIVGHLASQISRSGTSCALNYGEAQGGESKKDFIHKMQIVTKELRETKVCLRILQEAKFFKNNEKLNIAIKENTELISIFIKSVNTAKSNFARKQSNR